MSVKILKEIADAIPAAIKQVYREEGALFAAVFTLALPIAVPIAAVSYYTIPREKRELLEDSEAFAQ